MARGEVNAGGASQFGYEFVCKGFIDLAQHTDRHMSKFDSTPIERKLAVGSSVLDITQVPTDTFNSGSYSVEQGVVVRGSDGENVTVERFVQPHTGIDQCRPVLEHIRQFGRTGTDGGCVFRCDDAAIDEKSEE